MPFLALKEASNRIARLYGLMAKLSINKRCFIAFHRVIRIHLIIVRINNRLNWRINSDWKILALRTRM